MMTIVALLWKSGLGRVVGLGTAKMTELHCMNTKISQTHLYLHICQRLNYNYGDQRIKIHASLEKITEFYICLPKVVLATYTHLARYAPGFTW